MRDARPRKTAAQVRARRARFEAALLGTALSRGWRTLGFWGPLGCMLIGGLLRFWSLDRPHQLIFDETYYVKQGYSMIANGVELAWQGDGGKVDPQFVKGTLDVFKPGVGDMVVHPPVGKWVIGAGEALLGPTSSWGWRFSVALLGTISIFMVGRVARRLFRSDLIGTLASFLTMLDGQHFVQSRTSLLDLIVMFFALGGFGALLLDRDWARRRLAAAVANDPRAHPDARTLGWGPRLGLRPWRWVAAISLGLCLGTKWSGLYFLAGFGLMTVLWDVGARRTVGVCSPYRAVIRRDLVPAFVTLVPTALAVYLASWTGWFASTSGYNRSWADSRPATGWAQFVPDSLRSLWAYHVQTYEFHKGLTTEHAYQSNPWSWGFQTRPTSFFYEGPTKGQDGCAVEQCSKAISNVGTVSIWWLGTCAIVVLLFAWLVRRDWRAGAILVGLASGWLPWFTLQRRTIFTFYTIAFQPWIILACCFVLALALGGVGARAQRRRVGYLVVGGYALITLGLFAFFWPVWTAQVIPYSQWQLRMWFPSWI